LRPEGGEKQEEEKQKEESNPLEIAFGTDQQLPVLYQKFLSKTETQVNAGVALIDLHPSGRFLW
jgi:hypothetical protein